MESSMRSESSSQLIYPTQTALGRLRSSRFWRFLIGKFWGPAYPWLWENIINLRAKIIYRRNGFPKPGYDELRRTALQIVRDDPDFVSFANEIRAAIPAQALITQRERLLSKNEESAYICNLMPHLDDSTRYAMLRFALSPKVLDYVISYMGIVPRLSQIHLMYNIAHPSIPKPAGSAQWHRDGGGRYKCVNLFMCISEVDEGSGIYSAIPATEARVYELIPPEVKNMAESPWRRGRISDAQMDKYVDPSKIERLKGNPGTTAIVDPNLIYHKGGFCSERDRLMVQIHYCTEESYGWDSSHLTDWVDFKHPEVKQLLESSLNRFILSGKRSSILFPIRKLWYLVNCCLLVYYLKPRRIQAT